MHYLVNIGTKNHTIGKAVDSVDSPVILRPMTQAESVANRKEYQRRWMAAKRKAVRDARGVEKLSLVLPKALLADLRARKPKGLGLTQWLPQFLRESLQGPASPNLTGRSSPAKRASAARANSPKPDEPVSVPRNARCPCGSGRKFKACCGKSS